MNNINNICVKCGVRYATYNKNPCPVCELKKLITHSIHENACIKLSGNITKVLRELVSCYEMEHMQDTGLLKMFEGEGYKRSLFPKTDSKLEYINKKLLLEWFDLNTEVCLKEIYRIPPPNYEPLTHFDAIIAYIKMLRNRIEEGTYDLKE